MCRLENDTSLLQRTLSKAYVQQPGEGDQPPKECTTDVASINSVLFES